MLQLRSRQTAKTEAKRAHSRRVRRNRRRGPAPRRAFFEQLEDRRLLAVVSFNPGLYNGQYQVGTLPNVSGTTDVDLSPGTHNVKIAGTSNFTFDLDGAGNVTSNNTLAAVGAGSTLQFNTTSMHIDPADFGGSYYVGFVTTGAVGPRDVVLVPGLDNYVIKSGLTSFTFNVDGSGNVASNNSAAAAGTGTTLQMNTATTHIDPGGYGGSYYVSNVTTGTPGPLDVILVPGLANYEVKFIVGGSFTFDLDASGVPDPASVPVTIGTDSHTFLLSPIALVIDDVTVSEGDSGTSQAVLTVRLLGPASQPVTVNVATADGTAIAGADYQSASTTLVFDPGETLKTFAVTINSDTVEEPHRAFLVNLFTASGATIADGQAIVSLLDDDRVVVPSHTLFVTSTTHGTSSNPVVPPSFPDFGSLEAADWIVTFAAFNAGMIPDWHGYDLVWKALLSTSTQDARDRITIDGPVYNTRGELLAHDHAHLFGVTMFAPVRYDEFGHELIGFTDAWTGSNGTGSSTGSHCGSWTSGTSGSSGTTGAPLSRNNWINSSSVDCGSAARLFGVSPAAINNIAGSTQQVPLPPAALSVDSPAEFTFASADSGQWFELPPETRWEFRMANDALFTELVLPDGFTGQYILSVLGSETSHAQGSHIDLSSYPGGGVSEFTITPKGAGARRFPIRAIFDQPQADFAVIPVSFADCSVTVLNTNDSGLGSFREAIDCANTTPGLDTIDFNIPGAGPHTIQPLSQLPTINDPVTIDGYTQPGASLGCAKVSIA